MLQIKRLLPILLIILSYHAFGQASLPKAFGVGLELGIPSNSVYTVGFGGSGKAEVPVAGPLSITVTAGYTSLYFKTSLIGGAGKQSAAGFAPVKAGIKYFFSRGVYAEGEAGNVFETNYRKDNLFVFALGPGFAVPSGEHSSIDVGFRYENWGGGRIRQTAIRVAYRIGW
jgi:hypothetical protein